MSLQLMGVGTRHCRVLTVSNINSDATGVDMSGFHGLLYNFPERGLKLHLLEIFPFLCNARIYALPPKKPGFLPNLWTTTKYFRKKTRFLGPYLASLPLPQKGIDIKSRRIGINLTHSQETAVPFVVST